MRESGALSSPNHYTTWLREGGCVRSPGSHLPGYDAGVEGGDGGGLPRHHGEPLVHHVPHVALQGEGECDNKVPISLHYLAQGGGVAFPPLAPTYQAMMLEWKVVMVAACLATTGNHWSTMSPKSPCRVRESATIRSQIITLPGSGRGGCVPSPCSHLPGYDAGVEGGDGGGNLAGSFCQ